MGCSTRFCIRNLAIELVDKVLARERSTIHTSKIQQRLTITFVQRREVSRVLFQPSQEVGKRIVHFFWCVDSTRCRELSNHQAQVIQRRAYFTVCRKLAYIFAVLFRKNILGDDSKFIGHVLLQVSQEIICCICSVRASANRCVQRAHEFHDTVLGRRFTVVSRILHRAHRMVIFDQAKNTFVHRVDVSLQAFCREFLTDTVVERFSRDFRNSFLSKAFHQSTNSVDTFARTLEGQLIIRHHLLNHIQLIQNWVPSYACHRVIQELLSIVVLNITNHLLERFNSEFFVLLFDFSRIIVHRVNCRQQLVFDFRSHVVVNKRSLRVLILFVQRINFQIIKRVSCRIRRFFVFIVIQQRRCRLRLRSFFVFVVKQRRCSQRLFRTTLRRRSRTFVQIDFDFSLFENLSLVLFGGLNPIELPNSSVLVVLLRSSQNQPEQFQCNIVEVERITHLRPLTCRITVRVDLSGVEYVLPSFRVVLHSDSRALVLEREHLRCGIQFHVVRNGVQRKYNIARGKHSEYRVLRAKLSENLVQRLRNFRERSGFMVVVETLPVRSRSSSQVLWFRQRTLRRSNRGGVIVSKVRRKIARIRLVLLATDKFLVLDSVTVPVERFLFLGNVCHQMHDINVEIGFSLIVTAQEHVVLVGGAVERNETHPRIYRSRQKVCTYNQVLLCARKTQLLAIEVVRRELASLRHLFQVLAIHLQPILTHVSEST